VTGAAQMLSVRVSLAVRKQRGGRNLVLTPGGTTNLGPPAAGTTLVKALVRAFRWRRMMEAGRYGSLAERGRIVPVRAHLPMTASDPRPSR
jgi:hypothetical protein